MYPKVQKYLRRDEVVAVELPEMVSGDETYPGLILDGASGVGKTQQAFALLNDGKQELVYLLLIDPQSGILQVIYRHMASMTGMPGFLKMVDAAREAVSENTEQGKDPFSAANLYALRNNKIAPLDALVHFIADRVLKYDKDRKILSMAVKTSGKHTVADSIHRLTEKVLFLDEVLPPPSSDESSEDALNRLRFVRNLGRALGMRVVMAGAAAADANMISYREEGANAAPAASRENRAERGWIEIQFIWSPVQLPSLFGPNSFTAHKERPYLRSLLEDMPPKLPKSQTEILKYLAREIDEDKKLTNEGKLIWLSGCWLASEESMPSSSPFAIGPADLVKGHFFEPALAIIDEKDRRKPEEPHMGRGTKPKRRIKGPLRIALQRYTHQGIIWWALLSPNKKAGYSEDFQGVESALSHCVQSCLATEPVLAVSLSISHHFTPDEFANIFFKLWKEAPVQKSSGAMDGELNEYLMFAALQMACRAGDGADFPNTRSAAEMVERLSDYLSLAQPVPPPSDVVDEVRGRSGYTIEASNKCIPPKKITYSYGLDGKQNESFIRKVHNKTKMPWLVPAGSHIDLQNKIKETQDGGRPLFSELSTCIAGLVPRGNNSYLDASAYLWECDGQSKCAPLEWEFEFRGRSDSYSLTEAEATDDLVEKCDKVFKDTNDVDKPKFHAMLVALTGSMESECRIWLEDEKLRIVVLIGSRLV